MAGQDLNLRPSGYEGDCRRFKKCVRPLRLMGLGGFKKVMSFQY